MTLALAGCGGNDENPEIEQLQTDVGSVEAEVEELRDDLREAVAALDRLAGRVAGGAETTNENLAATDERLSNAIDDLAERVGALSEQLDRTEGGAAQALGELEAALGELSALVDAVVRAPLVDYFRAVERLAQTFEGTTEEGGEDLEAALVLGDLDAARIVLDDLVGATRTFSDSVGALQPPPQVATIHAEAAASLVDFTAAVSQLVVAVSDVATLEDFVAAFERLTDEGDLEAIESRNDAACEALQDAAQEFDIDVDLAC